MKPASDRKGFWRKIGKVGVLSTVLGALTLLGGFSGATWTVSSAINTKADRTEVKAVEECINTKADRSEVETLKASVSTKADQVSLEKVEDTVRRHGENLSSLNTSAEHTATSLGRIEDKLDKALGLK